ncbi:MAG: hypothetical protein GXO87_10385 [Chlorobi bacterium]|nr:hypothetical protein [Chlorobiota bacterium]
MGGLQAHFTETVDSLYDALSKIYENQYDLISEYILWKEERPDSVKNEGIPMNFLNFYKNSISLALRVPNISRLFVINDDFGLSGEYNKSRFVWNVSEGILADYSIDINVSSPREDRVGYQSIGRRNRFTRYFLADPRLYQGEPGINPPGLTTFHLRARGLGGYSMERRISYTPRIFGEGDGGFIDLPDDDSPPFTPGISFPNYMHTYNFVLRTHTYFTNDSTKIIAEWMSSDPQSDIVEYQYAIGESLDNKTSIMEWTSNGGRDDAVISGLNLDHNKSYHLFVKARNGEGLWSNIGGVTQKVKIDMTIPSTPGDVNEDGNDGGNDFFWDPPDGFGDGLGGGGFGDPFGGGNIPVDVIPPTPFPSGFGMYFYLPPPLDNYSAELEAHWTASIDPESGIHNYQYKVTSKKNSSVNSGWVDNDLDLNVSIRGGILNYLDSFYVDIRSNNLAGSASEELRYGPMRPIDASPPTQPNIAMAYAPNSDRVYLVFSGARGLSEDYESGIAFYEVSVGTTPGSGNLISWRNAITFKPEEVGGKMQVLLPVLPEINESYIQVRAVNGQGMRSSRTVTGPYYQDDTPPIRPGILPSTIMNLRGKKFLKLTYFDVEDPETGISDIKYSIYKGRNMIRGWTSAGVVDFTIIRLSDLGLHIGDRIEVWVETRNGLGMRSRQNHTSYIIR